MDNRIASTNKVARYLDIINPLHNHIEAITAEKIILHLFIRRIKRYMKFAQSRFDKVQSNFWCDKTCISVDVYACACSVANLISPSSPHKSSPSNNGSPPVMYI